MLNELLECLIDLAVFVALPVEFAVLTGRPE
jgi:hypothetical protein